MALTPRQVYGGVPYSDAYQPLKSDIIDLWNATLFKQTGANAGALIQTSKAALDALAPTANTMAWVLGDADPDLDGVYQYASSTWTKRGPLPYGTIHLNNAGAGTGDAIEVTTAFGVPDAAYSALYELNISHANTGGVTVAINGAAAVPLINNQGGALVAGTLQPGMSVLVIDDGTGLRMLTDGRTVVPGAAGQFAGFDGNGNVIPLAAPDGGGDMNSAFYDPSGVGLNVYGGRATFADIATATGATIAPSIKEIATQARDRTVSVGLGGAPYKRVTSEPSHEMKFRSSDRYLPDGTTDATNGGWWEYAGKFLFPEQAGAVGVSGTDDSHALRRSFVAAAALGIAVWLAGDVYAGSRVLVPSNTHVYGMGGTLYNEHAQAVAGFVNGLFVTENYADPTNVEVENIGFHGVRIRDSILPTDECCFFAITNCDGFTLEDCDIVKASVSWTTAIAADNVKILNNEIDTTGADSFCDAIHILEGTHGVIGGNTLNTEDDCIAFHNHSYANFKRGNIIKDWRVYGNSGRSAIANGLRIGAANTASADFYIDGITAEKSNHFYSGVIFDDDRTTINQKHRNLVVSCAVCEERISQPSTSAAYRDITLVEANANPTGVYSTAATTLAINFVGGGVETVYLKRSKLNQGNYSAGNNIHIKASVKIEFVDNDVKTNATGNGVLLDAPEIINKGNRVRSTAGFRVVYMISSTSLDYAEVVGNKLTGAASNGLISTGGAYLLVDRNHIDPASITTAYGLGTWTAGAGRLHGAGAPAMTAPNSVEYFRTDGGTNTTRYLREAGAWVAK